MEKRGQITIFVIIGVLIVFAAAIVLFALSLREGELVQVPVEVEPVKLYIDSCIERTAKDAIVDISSKGGYYVLPEFSTMEVPYYFYEIKGNVPQLSLIEGQLSMYVENNLKNCIDLTDFAGRGINVNLGEVSAKSFIRQNSIFFDLDFPTKITSAGRTTEISKFSITIDNVRMPAIHNASAEVINLQSEDPFSLCISCAADIAYSNNLVISTANIENNSVLFTITDLNSLIDEEPLVFRFTNKYIPYNCSNLPSTLPESMLRGKTIECIQQI